MHYGLCIPYIIIIMCLIRECVNGTLKLFIYNYVVQFVCNNLFIMWAHNNISVIILIVYVFQ